MDIYIRDQLWIEDILEKYLAPFLSNTRNESYIKSLQNEIAEIKGEIETLKKSILISPNPKDDK